MQDKKTYGFIYIWRDRKRNRYYIGSHWGTSDDGYICSSNWMRMSHKRRPEDFKRRIIQRINTNRQDLLAEEQKWLNLIKDEELSKRYFNHNKQVLYNAWWLDEERGKTVRERISIARKGIKLSEEHKKNLGKSMKFVLSKPETKRKMSESHIGHCPSEETKKKMSKSKIGNTNNLGIPHSEEQKRKISESLKGNKRSFGYYPSEETKKKMSESQRLRWRMRKVA